MKKRILVISLIALSAFLAWWNWPRARLIDKATPTTTSATTPDEASGSSEKPPVGPIAPAPAPAVIAKPGMKEQLQEIMSNGNRPISFFGKIIDQDGNPIPDVKVTFTIRYIKEVGPIGIGDTFKYPSVKTGADGRFALTDEKGSLLVIKSFEKAGYEPSPKAFDGTYWYWRDKDPYQPDADNPKLFYMWKKAGAETLVRKGIGHAIRYDGSPTTFDLLTGKVASNGDLRVTLIRTPQQIIYGQRNYEWTATIEVPEGGLLLSTAEQMYLAPSDGYEKKVTIHMNADDPQWTNTQNAALYLKLRGGKYYGRAKLEFMVGSDRDTTPFSITSFVNPSGSRNLEYDPTQNIIKDPPPRTRTATPTP